MNRVPLRPALTLLAAIASNAMAEGPETHTLKPSFQTVDLDRGETVQVKVGPETTSSVRLISLDVTVDPIRSAVRRAQVHVVIDGKPVTLESGNYHLPVTSGNVQVDCPVVSAYLRMTTVEHWGLDKEARLRFWPA